MTHGKYVQNVFAFHIGGIIIKSSIKVVII